MLMLFADRKLFVYGSNKQDLESLTTFVTGGYKNNDPLNVPPAPAWWMKYPLMITTALDMSHLIEKRTNAAVVLFVFGTLFGTTVLALLVLIIFRPRKSHGKED